MFPRIIPYQELLGNYDCWCLAPHAYAIIPYQELLGNYDSDYEVKRRGSIIPYQELAVKFIEQSCFEMRTLAKRENLCYNTHERQRRRLIALLSDGAFFFLIRRNGV